MHVSADMWWTVTPISIIQCPDTRISSEHPQEKDNDWLASRKAAVKPAKEIALKWERSDLV